MRVHPVPPTLTTLLVDLHTRVTAAAPHDLIDVHALITASPKGTVADKAVVAALADSTGIHLGTGSTADTAADLVSPRGHLLRTRLSTALGSRWHEVYELAATCAEMSTEQARTILGYARSHRRPQRNALRALDTAPGLATGPSINAIAVVIDALEHNPALGPDHLTNGQFAMLCDEMAGTGRAICVWHLAGKTGSGRLKRGHLDALTASYRILRNQHATATAI